MAEDTITFQCRCGEIHEIDPEELGLESVNKYHDDKPAPVRFELTRLGFAALTGLANLASAVFQDLTNLAIHRGRLRARQNKSDTPAQQESNIDPRAGGLTSE